jgi:hypothetical protein
MFGCIWMTEQQAFVAAVLFILNILPVESEKRHVTQVSRAGRVQTRDF